jgi:hypothetical protein
MLSGLKKTESTIVQSPGIEKSLGEELLNNILYLPIYLAVFYGPNRSIIK